MTPRGPDCGQPSGGVTKSGLTGEPDEGRWSYDVPCPRCHDEACEFLPSIDRRRVTCVVCGAQQGPGVVERIAEEVIP